MIYVDDVEHLRIIPVIPDILENGRPFEVSAAIVNSGEKPESFCDGTPAVDLDFVLRRQGCIQWTHLDGRIADNPFELRRVILAMNWIVGLNSNEGHLFISHLKLKNIEPGIYEMAVVKRNTSCGVIKAFRPVLVE